MTQVKVGYVTWSLGAGSPGEGELFLRGPRHQRYRLKWKKADKDRRRALPVGRYTITGYRIVRKDKNDVPWFVSTTSNGYRKLVVKPGEVSRIKIDPAVYLKAEGTLHEGTLRAQMMVNGERHGGLHHRHQVGLSIYRQGKRIPIAYRALDRQGKVVASGTMKYG